MDRVAAALLESWDRQADIVNRLAAAVDEELLPLRPAPESWTVHYHLCHIHEVRWYWLGHASKAHTGGLGDVFRQVGDEYEPIGGLDLVRSELVKSGKAVCEAVRSLIEAGVEPAGPYSHPVMFLQHMVWHEGWHVGLIVQAFRAAGRELSEEWEEENIWGIWRAYG
jgi:uncharacterized damage-inducible protein DinB